MTKEHEIADIVVYLRLPSREAIKRKHTTALHKLAGNQAGNMAGNMAGNRPLDVAIPYLQSPLCSQTGV